MYIPCPRASLLVRLSILFFLFTTVCFLCITSVSASTNYAQQLQRISTDEGLSQNYVTKILQDDLGYIWIATAQGLNRFDGDVGGSARFAPFPARPVPLQAAAGT